MLAQPTAPESDFIKVDQFGYLPNASKVAVISDPQIGYNADNSFTPSDTYQVREWQSGNVVFSTALQTWNDSATHTQSGDKGWWFDFSSVTTAGTYYLYDPLNDVRSYEFEIHEDVYNNALHAATRMFYYNRCGIAKIAPYAEAAWTYNGAAFQEQDSNCRFYRTPDDANSAKDLSGGWFDAGDFNKYTTNANRPVQDLLWAYREHPSVFADNWNIPESGNGIPDVLDELKWELDWLLKMNNPDGSTHIKMGSISHNDNAQVPPDVNSDPRYYAPVCSSAAIAVAGMFAHAAKVYQEIPSMRDYAETLRNRAETTWNYVLPALNSNQLDANCDDQTIKSGDADWPVNIQRERALAAAIYLFELTGKATYNQYIINNINDAPQQINNFYWDQYMMPLNDALLLYTSLPNADATITNLILNSIQADVDGNGSGLYGFDENADLYRVQMPGYYWGGNREISAIGAFNQLLIKYNINPESHAAYQLRSQQMAHYIHGVNPQGMTYLTNMYNLGGDKCANEMYHEWFKDGSRWDNALTAAGPAPGYLVGGANQAFSGTTSPPANQPPQKSYLDYNTAWPDASWEITEPSITYQGAYVRLIASLATSGGTTCPAAATSCNDTDPNTVNDAQDGFCNCSGTLAENEDCELLTNGAFEEDSSWETWGCTAFFSNGVAKLVDIAVGANSWDAGFQQTGITLEQGKTYTATFSVRADANRSLDFKIGPSNYVFETINLSANMQTYSYTFVMNEPTNTNASFEFLIGTSFMSVYIENARLAESDCEADTCPAEGTLCDDGNAATENDIEDGFCNCAGTPIQTADCELLLNAGFDTDVYDWNIWNCTANAVNGVAQLTNIAAVANPWDASFSQSKRTLEQGKTYTATFSARADASRSLRFKLGLSVAPWTNYVSETINLSTEMQTYSYTFVMNDPTSANVNFSFLLGASSSNVYITNTSLVENDCGESTCPAAGTRCDDGNPNTENDVEDGFCNCAGTPIQTNACQLLTNASFDTDVADWNAWACTATSVNGVANLSNISAGANAWDAGFHQSGLRLEQGKSYTLIIRARAENNRSMDVKLGTDTAPWIDYFYETLSLTTSFQTFVYTISMSGETNSNASLDLLIGASSANIYIEAVSLLENGCATSPSACELLSNAAFEADVSDWNTWACTATAVNGVVNLRNISAGANTWDAGFSQEGVTLEQGKAYIATFTARADNNRSLDFKIGLPVAPWTNYVYETINLSTNMQTYTYAFVMNEPTNTNVSFEFFLGANAANIYIESTSLVQSNCLGGSSFTNATYATPSNLNISSDNLAEVQLYPNPARQSIQLLSKTESTPAQIQIHDAFGKLVKQIEAVEFMANVPIQVELNQLPAGMYFCTVQCATWKSIQKFFLVRE